MMMRKTHKHLIFIMAAGLCVASVTACATTPKDSKSATDTSTSSDTPTDKTPKKKTIQYNVDALKDAELDIENALAKIHKGDNAGAITALENVAKKSPKAFLAQHNLGILYEHNQDEAKARQAYTAALVAEPKYTPSLMNLVRIDIRKGDVNAALQTAERYVSKTPDAFEHNYPHLEALIANQRYDVVTTEVRRLLKIDEANAKLRYYLALNEFSRKQYHLADFILNESLGIEAEDPEALFLRARIYDALSAEEITLVPKISETLDHVIRIDPYHSEALWMRGIIYYEANSLEQAEDHFRRVLALNPALADSYINLGNVLKTQNRGPEAEKNLLRAKELAPKNGLVDFSLGMLYLSTETIDLPAVKDMDRLKIARKNFQDAEKNWSNRDDIALAKRYIKTTDDAIETLQTMLDAEAFFATPPPAEPAPPAPKAPPVTNVDAPPQNVYKPGTTVD